MPVWVYCYNFTGKKLFLDGSADFQKNIFVQVNSCNEIARDVFRILSNF